jgi:RNA polymerase sigma-70 factor (ECF subfamily)
VPERNDGELLILAAGGDDAAAGKLFDRHAPRLMRYLTLMLGEPQAAEDVLQNSFAYLFNHAAEYDPDRAAVGTWLARIARSYAKNELRRRGRKPFISLSTPVAAGGDEPRALEELLAEAQPGYDRADLELALQAISELPRKEREALVMRFVDGLEPREIAEVLGLKPKAISMRIWRALGRIRTMIRDGPDSE